MSRDSLVRMTSAGDEGGGVGAAAFRTAPRPSALREVQGSDPYGSIAD